MIRLRFSMPRGRSVGTIVTLLSALILPALCGAQNVFIVPPTYPTGSFPVNVVSADFNGDGAPDVAAPNYSDNTTSVLLNNGDGTFRAAVNYNVGTGPEAASSGDFNGDGSPDLAVVNWSDGTVSILLAKHDGTFRSPKTYPVGANPGYIVSADLDGDGKLDLIVTDDGETAGITVLLGHGDGTFNPGVFYGTEVFPVGPVVADFNLDGKPDVAVGNCTDVPGSLSVLLGNGDGSLQSPTRYEISGACPVLTAGDFNGDGRQDLAAVSSNPDGTVNILLASPGGGFQAPLTNLAGINPDAVSANDLNGDGKLDLVVSNNTSNNISFLMGNGDGTLQPPINYAMGGDPFGVAVADFNGDGKPDIATANVVSDSVTIMLANNNGLYQAMPSCSSAFGGYMGAVGDLNGDNFPDIVVPSYISDGVSVCLNRGDGTFVMSGQFAAGLDPQFAAVGDFNNDNKLDVMVTNNDSHGSIGILLGNGDGSLRNVVDTVIGGGGFGLAAVSALGDFNQDGKLDIALSYGMTLLGNGDGTFHIVNTTVGAGAVLATGDLDGDGKLDLAASTGGTVTVYLGRGDGTFREGAHYSICGGNGFTATLEIVDLDKDGKQDVMAFHELNAGGCAGILLGNGDGTLRVAGTYQINDQSEYATVADFDGDGRPDLALAHRGKVALFLGNGDGTFQPYVEYPVASGFTFLTAGDVNGDGFTDAVVVSQEGFADALLSASSHAASLSKNRLNFGSQVIDTRSPATSVTLTNSGKGDLNITGIDIAGPFLEKNDCGTRLAPGESCSIKIKFFPRKRGEERGAITISDNAPDSPQTIQLSGAGTVVQFTPISLDFGSEKVGHQSPPGKLTLTNLGKVSLSISDISILGYNAGDFAQTNNCGPSVAAGASCEINVTFTPLARKDRKARISANDNGGGSPQVARLFGTGT